MARCFVVFFLVLFASSAAATFGNLTGVEPFSFLIRTLHSALDAVSPLDASFSAHIARVEQSQRGAVGDCAFLHAAAAAAISRAVVLLGQPDGVADVRTHLSAALTNRATCLEGLAGAGGAAPALEPLLSVAASAYKLVSESLALASSHESALLHRNRVRRINDFSDDGEGSGGDDYAVVITVAKDGSGNYTTVSAAVAAVPDYSHVRSLISIKAGVYEENVQVPSSKTNVVMLGEGRGVTVITGARSVGDGSTTFDSATVAVSGDGFLARDITFRNSADAGKGQAVALRVNANRVAVYRCAVEGHQDALYAHSYQQFYRECDISGTVDFIFGNAAAVFQGCTILVKAPIPGQENAIAAHGRDDPNENTGFSMQNCSVRAAAGENLAGTKTYLGRPWGPYARTVFMESEIDGIVDGSGWVEWPGGHGLDTLYFGEYMNSGAGAATGGRVGWPGYHKMSYADASGFSVASLIAGDDWLGSTSFPYDSEV